MADLSVNQNKTSLSYATSLQCNVTWNVMFYYQRKGYIKMNHIILSAPRWAIPSSNISMAKSMVHCLNKAFLSAYDARLAVLIIFWDNLFISGVRVNPRYTYDSTQGIYYPLRTWNWWNYRLCFCFILD